MSETFLVHYIFNTLPAQYGPFKIFYNTYKDTWSINELMAMCVQEEGRLLMEIGESAFTTTQGQKSHQANKNLKGKAPLDSDVKKEFKCRFCGKKGHIKKDYVKFQRWLKKKGLKKTCGSQWELNEASIQETRCSRMQKLLEHAI
ncbi:uncharacterized protein LOC124890646 [Capsicum annuum]|uniref:uncharacterized protein LOC124890646 n=1 Tax=Capsicum annuum TaxID=4072 RepID=UPI001FB15BE1|nr:uncharacterized protein LOC124890646 [Capsicum annuum]